MVGCYSHFAGSHHPDPAFHSKADPDPEPSFHLYVDPDPAFYEEREEAWFSAAPTHAISSIKKNEPLKKNIPEQIKDIKFPQTCHKPSMTRIFSILLEIQQCL